MVAKMNKTIKTDRLILRPLTTDDAADMFEWTSDPVVNRYMPYSLNKDISQTIDYLSSIPDEANEFAFCLQSTGKVIGSGGISFDPDRNAWELGYNLNRAYWGNGYATEAAKAMIEWAYATLGARDFACNHANANEASRKVILKCGFTFDHYGQYSRFDGSETFDASFYVMHLD